MNGLGVAGIALAAAAIIGGAVLAPSVIQAKELEELRSSCWSQETQDSFGRLSTSIVKDQLLRIAKTSGGGLSPAEIDRATTVKGGGFHTTAVDEKSRSASCAATIDFVFKRKDGKQLQNSGTVVAFEVHPSGAGQVVSMTRGEIFRNIIEAAQVDD